MKRLTEFLTQRESNLSLASLLPFFLLSGTAAKRIAFVTGLDEHGQKVAETAEKHGMTVHALVAGNRVRGDGRVGRAQMRRNSNAGNSVMTLPKA